MSCDTHPSLVRPSQPHPGDLQTVVQDMVTKEWGGWRKSPGERNRQTWWVCQYLISGLSVAKARHSAALPHWLSLFTNSPSLKLVFAFLPQEPQPLEFSKPWDSTIPHSRRIFPQLVFGNQHRICQAKGYLEVIDYDHTVHPQFHVPDQLFHGMKSSLHTLYSVMCKQGQ